MKKLYKLKFSLKYMIKMIHWFLLNY